MANMQFLGTLMYESPGRKQMIHSSRVIEKCGQEAVCRAVDRVSRNTAKDSAVIQG